MRTTFQSGKWLAICDICGFRFHNDKLKKDWRGLMVCKQDWEPRHPQDYIHGVEDRSAPPWTRPESTDIFIPVNFALGQSTINQEEINGFIINE